MVLLIGACVAFGYIQGVSRESDRRDAQELKRTNTGIAIANKETARREALGAAREVIRERIRVVYRTIKVEAENNVEKNAVVYADCGLDADGLRLWNAANSGSAAPVPGEPDGGLSGAAARALGEAGGSAAEPYRGDGAGSAMPRPAQEAGGVREPAATVGP
ncbi:MAG TPA: hypothetical protein VFQ99_05735 [Gallionella sp.]|nr:hypothetical protein [Gallionella sp.]